MIFVEKNFDIDLQSCIPSKLYTFLQESLYITTRCGYIDFAKVTSDFNALLSNLYLRKQEGFTSTALANRCLWAQCNNQSIKATLET